MSAAKRKKRPRGSTSNQSALSSRKTFKLYRPSGSVPFPQVRGKTLADVYLTTDRDISCVILCFDDNTELVLDIEPCLSFAADYSDWKTGNERIIKRWPRVRST
jgi:hypothetical protein